MTDYIVNAAPMVLDRGTQDLSTRKVPRVPEAVPQHLPKFFLYAQKGDPSPQLVSSSEAMALFGSETFNLRGKYANHATVFADGVLAQGNICMIKRVIPDDAGPNATLVAWLDVLPTTIDLYERNTDGSIKLNSLNDPIVIGTTQGYKVKWVVTNYTDALSAQQYGQLAIMKGDQIDATTGVQSDRYPMFELKTSSQGYDGNLSGISLWAPTIQSVTALPTKLMNESHVYPYFISVMRRESVQKSPKPVATLFGEQKVMITLKKDTFDPTTTAPLYVGDTFIDSYQNITDLRYAKQYGNFSDMKVYDANIDTVLTMFHAAEAPHINQFSDFTADPAQKHLFNMVSGVSSYNVPYNSFMFTDSPNTVRFSEFTNVFAGGGSDGTMNDTLFAELVKTEMAAYLDPNHPVQERAINVESIIYDSGFPLDTKYALCNIMAIRKDTFPVLSTYVAGAPRPTAVDDHAVAIALRTHLQMFPESDYFGTPVMRGMIQGNCGKVHDSLYKGDLPLTYEIAIKAAKYMGAADGRWKDKESFSGAPGSIVEYMYDFAITNVPGTVRNRNWDVGLNWVQPYDRESFFFPAFKTVYDDDTSVLNSFSTVMAICQINKIVHAAWREFAGKDDMTNGELVTAVNDFVNKRTANRFNGRFVIVPQAQMTDMDMLRGYSWTLPVQIYAPNMKTVMTTYVQANRIDDLATASA